MLVTSKKAKADQESAFIEGRDAYIASLQAWHKKCAEKQASLELSFDPQAISEFSINVWDNDPEEEGTYAYVEMSEVPDKVCFDVLLHLLEYARSNSNITATGALFRIRFHDSSVAYPILIGRRDGEYSLFKRWEMTIEGVTYEMLELIVDQLKKAPAFDNKPLNVYSES